MSRPRSSSLDISGGALTRLQAKRAQAHQDQLSERTKRAIRRANSVPLPARTRRRRRKITVCGPGSAAEVSDESEQDEPSPAEDKEDRENRERWDTVFNNPDTMNIDGLFLDLRRYRTFGDLVDISDEGKLARFQDSFFQRITDKKDKVVMKVTQQNTSGDEEDYFIPMITFTQQQVRDLFKEGDQKWDTIVEFVSEQGSDGQDKLERKQNKGRKTHRIKDMPLRVTLLVVKKRAPKASIGSDRSSSRSRSRSNSQPRKDKSAKKPTARSRQREKQAGSSHVGQRYERNSTNVSFFPYINTSDIPLEYAQIYTSGHDEKAVEHCLISTLRFFQVQEEVLSRVSFALAGHAFHIPRKDFKVVCRLANVNFHLSMFHNNTEMKRRNFDIFNDKQDDATITVKAGLFMDHIFPNIQTEYSLFYLRNMGKIKAGNYCRPLDISRFQANGQPKYSPDIKRVDTLSVVRELFISNCFVQSSSIRRVKLPDTPIISAVSLANEQQEFEAKESEDCSTLFFAADLEAYVEGQHKCCLAAICIIPDNKSDVSADMLRHVTIFSENDPIGEMFLFLSRLIRKRGRQRGRPYDKHVLFFHNLRYDRSLFETHHDLIIQKIVIKDNQIYSLQLRCHGFVIEVRDSLKMIPVGISKFCKTFKLPDIMNKKDELILYDYFKPENMRENTFRCNVFEYTEDHTFAGGHEERADFMYRLTQQLPLIEEVKFSSADKTFYPKALYMYYLKFDVAILAAGLAVFRSEFNSLTDNELDVLDSLTISSYAYKHMGYYGAFENSYQVSGNIRAFLGLAVYGGRVMCNSKYEGTSVTGVDLDYFDACSLYPSAIDYICRVRGGFPTGPAKVITPQLKEYSVLQQVAREYTVRVRITRIDRKQFSIPFIAWRHDNRIDYIQEMPPDLDFLEVVVDKQTLEDYIEYHQIQFEILEGVFWDGDLNPTWGEIVNRLYSARLTAKAQGQPVKADCIKLILNSAYGKTITRCSNTQVSYIPKKKYGKPKDWELSISNAFHVIQKYREVGPNQVEVHKYQLDKSYNMAKYGSMILAASKHLMNEVFDLMSVNEMPIYYTDTDSFVMRKNDRDVLAERFESKFGRRLIGKQLGNFHSDFSFKYQGRDVDPDLVHSVEFIPAGRKLYIHKLVALVDGEVRQSIQFKAKGCTVEGMWHAAAKFGQGDEGMMKLYRHLTTGAKIPITLNPIGKKVKFVYSKTNAVSTPDVRFVRNICSQAARDRECDDGFGISSDEEESEAEFSDDKNVIF